MGLPPSASGNKKSEKVKPVLEWTVREWLEYHQQRIHQGSIEGSPQLQQSWMGRIIWKNPLDCWIYQEILFDTRPEVVLEIGVAHGGSTLFLANMLDLLDRDGATVVGIDSDLSNVADLRHPRVRLIEGRCLDPVTLEQVRQICDGRKTMVISDCDHHKDHVLEELRTYSPLVGLGCYYVVEDGICDEMGWAPVPGPKAGCKEFLRENPRFVNDSELREKYRITYNFNGYLKRVA